MTNVCGTGGWAGPLPGDPDNNVTLSATAVFGGIMVSWSYPSINSFAVAHTLLYRATSVDFNTAIQIAVVAGNSYLDRMDGVNTFFYWIKIVSINGTVGELIGPASATSTLFSGDIYQYLAGLIDQGVLAQALKDDIARITINAQDIANEIANRIAASAAISAFLAQVQADSNTVSTLVLNEVTRSINADAALVSSINAIAATSNGNTAAIASEQLVRADADSILANSITVLQGTVAGNTASILTEQTIRANADTAFASSMSALSTSVNANAAAILNEQTVRSNADSAEALARNNLAVVVNTINNSLSAAIQTEQNARIINDNNNFNALVNYTNSIQAAMGSNISQIEVRMQSNIDSTNGVVNNIGALYTAKLNVNGLIGGFGVYNNGAFVEAGFDVDRFWIGRTNANKRKPFIIANDTVYLDKARIRDADIDTLKIAGNSISRSIFVQGATPIISTGSILVFGRVHMTAMIYANEVLARTVSILRDGQVISQTSGILGFYTLTFVDEPYPGYHTYTVDGSHSINGIHFQLLDIQR